MSSDQFLETPQAPPQLNIPESQTTVKVSCIDSTSHLVLGMSAFLQPDFVGAPHMDCPSFAFLIQHPDRKPILFDLGIRKDWQELRAASKFKELNWTIEVQKNVSEILQESGEVDVAGGGIESIIFSHHHWDHVGTATSFPPSTELVVGPGFTKEFLPGYPVNPDSPMLAADFANRPLRELPFDDSLPRIGRFRAFDYFGDGSLYLLDTPGHTVAHMCALARTTAATASAPATFVFLGGDAAHHSAEYRPSAYLPLPRKLEAKGIMPAHAHHVCPGELFESINPHASAAKPYWHPTKFISHNQEETQWTIAGMQELDAHANVLMLIAHDATLLRHEGDGAKLPLFPQVLNNWYVEKVKPAVTWLFLRDFVPAVEAQKQGKKPFMWSSEEERESAMRLVGGK